MKLAALTMCLGLAVAACGNLDAEAPPEDVTASGSEDVGMIEMALMAVPADVACVRITAKGPTREKIADVDVVPGPSVSQVLTGFPLGQVKIAAEAFGSACEKVTSKATPSWVSDTKDISIVEGTKTRVEFNMTRNGRVDVSFNFPDEPACSAVGVVCGTNKECCSGVCKSDVCQAAPVSP
ncbi:MAG: hypothetical protein SF187_21490 [Deltaproteobacteria bacterium]|nr:hypothetical protein [Deltaproteobacteria bacterium]